MQPGMLGSSGMAIGMGGVGGMPAHMQGAMQGMGQPGEVSTSWSALQLQLCGVSQRHADQNGCKRMHFLMARPINMPTDGIQVLARHGTQGLDRRMACRSAHWLASC